MKSRGEWVSSIHLIDALLEGIYVTVVFLIIVNPLFDENAECWSAHEIFQESRETLVISIIIHQDQAPFDFIFFQKVLLAENVARVRMLRQRITIFGVSFPIRFFNANFEVFEYLTEEVEEESAYLAHFLSLEWLLLLRLIQSIIATVLPIIK